MRLVFLFHCAICKYFHTFIILLIINMIILTFCTFKLAFTFWAMRNIAFVTNYSIKVKTWCTIFTFPEINTFLWFQTIWLVFKAWVQTVIKLSGAANSWWSWNHSTFTICAFSFEIFTIFTEFAALINLFTFITLIPIPVMSFIAGATPVTICVFI